MAKNNDDDDDDDDDDEVQRPCETDVFGYIMTILSYFYFYFY